MFQDYQGIRDYLINQFGQESVDTFSFRWHFLILYVAMSRGPWMSIKNEYQRVYIIVVVYTFVSKIPWALGHFYIPSCLVWCTYPRIPNHSWRTMRSVADISSFPIAGVSGQLRNYIKGTAPHFVYKRRCHLCLYDACNVMKCDRPLFLLEGVAQHLSDGHQVYPTVIAVHLLGYSRLNQIGLWSLSSWHTNEAKRYSALVQFDMLLCKYKSLHCTHCVENKLNKSEKHMNDYASNSLFSVDVVPH